ncbi:TPA: hypothetical protein DDZ01_03160 [Candidatus Uhrbacteria bacterium]|nr:hypothetical protein [Candidatus Uhrbacteria bacterium]HCB55834.1 hypothetical protein [Candidatus Uhrbacteria bacterium]
MNIGSNNSYPGNKLSNFPPAPFQIDGVQCASTEGFIQALKFPDPEMQRHVCSLVGREAKFKGKKANKRVQHMGKVWWQGREIEFRSQEHMDLIERGLRAKFTQCDSARRALLATREATLTHHTGYKESPHTSLPARDFIRMLYKIRKELQQQEASSSNHGSSRRSKK